MDVGVDGVYIKNYRLGVHERVDENVGCPWHLGLLPVFAWSMFPLETKAMSFFNDIITGSTKWPGGGEDRIKSPFVAGKSDSRRPSHWAGG